MPYSPPTYRAVLSPCIGVCTIGQAGHCLGCFRTMDEIASWTMLGDAERLELMESVLPQRDVDRA